MQRVWKVVESCNDHQLQICCWLYRINLKKTVKYFMKLWRYETYWLAFYGSPGTFSTIYEYYFFFNYNLAGSCKVV